jgi:hypothetical protein
MRVWFFTAVLGFLVTIAAPLRSNANQCVLPANKVDVQYRSYSERAEFPTTGLLSLSARQLIDFHILLAQDIFVTAGLELEFVDSNLLAPVLLSEHRADMIKDLLSGILGPDPENAVSDFKTTAQSEGFYNPSKLNIYYIDVADLTGIHFRNREGMSHNIIIMGLGFNDETLAHELGHAFSLNHTNFWTHDDPELDQIPNGIQVEYCVEYAYWNNVCDFNRGNLMWAAQEFRSELTAGQGVRIACNHTSSIVVNQDWNPPVIIDCPDFSTEGTCPEVF